MNVGDISDLLDIVERTMGRPKLKAIHDKAMKELEDAAKEIENEGKEPAEERRVA